MKRRWTLLFAAAAAYNLAIGGLGLANPSATIDNRAVAVLVLAFGLVYFLVAREPARLAPVAWAGVFGKLGIVLLLGPGALESGANPALMPILAGDLLFACFFVAFLLGPARHARTGGEG